MNQRVIAALYAAVVGLALGWPSPVPADEAIKNLSLEHERFTLAPDPKVPSPSVLGARFGFGGAKGFKPYLGTGVVYTLLPETKSGDPFKIKTGVAAQAGASYLLGGNLSLSLDYKYLYIPPEAQRGDAPSQSIGVGVKIQF